MNLSRANPSEIAPPADRGARLVGWKDIAAYLGKTDRTVKRWGRDRGLPVHRVPGTAKTSVYAYSNELDRWLDYGETETPEEAGELVRAPDPMEQAPAPVLASNPLRPFFRRRWLLAGLALFL